MRGLRQGVLPEQQSDHAHAQAHRLQTVPMRPLRQGVPEEGRSSTAQRGTASGSTRPGLSLPPITLAARQRQTLSTPAACLRLSHDTCPRQQLRFFAELIAFTQTESPLNLHPSQFASSRSLSPCTIGRKCEVESGELLGNGRDEFEIGF